MNVIVQAWRRVPTVSAKFLLILVPVLVATTLVSASLFFYGRQQQLRGALHGRIAAMAEVNASALAPLLWAFDATGVRNVVQAIAVNREVLCVEVSDDLADSRYVWPPPGCPAGSALAVERRPIRTQAQPIGSIALHYSNATVWEQIRQEALNTLWLIALMLACTVLAALGAQRWTIGRPLRRLVAAIEEAERTHAPRPVSWASADELGRVIRAYNAMLARLDAEEAALRRSEERLSLAITATRSSVWDYHLRTGDYWWSREFPALLGYSPDELPMTTATWESLLHPDDAERVIRGSRRRVRDTATSYTAVYRMRRRDGRWAWIEDRSTALRGAGGTALRLTGTMSDATERVQAELDLARERNVLQITLDNTDQGIMMVDRDLRVVMSNRRAAELLNIWPEFLAGNPSFADVVELQRGAGAFDEVGDDPDLHLAGLAEDGTGLEGNAPGRLDQPFAFKRRRPDGTIVELRTNPLPEGGFVRTVTDVTVEARSAESIFEAMQALEVAYADLKETQASLVQAEKMASLALLVAGVAHEINTPVGIAFGCASHLTAKTQDLAAAFESGTMKKSDLTAYVAAAGEASRLIQQNLTRAAELIQSFKRVAVDQTSEERRRFDLLSYLEEIITSLGPTLRKSPHRIALACSPGVTLDSYPGAFSQVVTNLIMNALTHAFPDHAFPDGTRGHIVIDVNELPDDELAIRFADDGVGIPEENLPKVFEPFFTTRRGTGGSGLGLHIVFNLVTQSLGGRIGVDSRAGDGTTFTLRIPKTAPTITGEAATPDAAAPDPANPDCADPDCADPDSAGQAPAITEGTAA
ncbi:ATP-binding protein [Azospirillum thermophilum]|uniref:histidine kinase n=1 Tax=Azospirillum thermophilum TaxID=2202148 RepID=A0A2S2CSI2_9PROT|nr:ATP-binding protein [Azospirillum thermophilum]AWK87429.1 PAS domain-containing sensor histidine kinase [Azospirillum thermophilum]